MIEYLLTHRTQYIGLIFQHLKISFLVVTVAILIGAPIGLYATHSDKLYRIISGFFSFLKIIPSLAVLVLCIPIFGVGEFPAMVALAFLALPTILTSSALAFRSVPAHIIESAVGIGMDNRMIFFQVQLPLALPTILSGIRTCLVEVISCATLASYIGAGGLGNLILIGFGNRFDILLLGGLSVAALAIAADSLLFLLEWWVTAYKRK